jgi:hypothetical protein
MGETVGGALRERARERERERESERERERARARERERERERTGGVGGGKEGSSNHRMRAGGNRCQAMRRGGLLNICLVRQSLKMN